MVSKFRTPPPPSSRCFHTSCRTLLKPNIYRDLVMQKTARIELRCHTSQKKLLKQIAREKRVSVSDICSTAINHIISQHHLTIAHQYEGE